MLMYIARYSKKSESGEEVNVIESLKAIVHGEISTCIIVNEFSQEFHTRQTNNPKLLVNKCNKCTKFVNT